MEVWSLRCAALCVGAAAASVAMAMADGDGDGDGWMAAWLVRRCLIVTLTRAHREKRMQNVGYWQKNEFYYIPSCTVVLNLEMLATR